jgi:hypothetical protein
MGFHSMLSEDAMVADFFTWISDIWRAESLYPSPVYCLDYLNIIFLAGWTLFYGWQIPASSVRRKVAFWATVGSLAFAAGVFLFGFLRSHVLIWSLSLGGILILFINSCVMVWVGWRLLKRKPNLAKASSRLR